MPDLTTLWTRSRLSLAGRIMDMPVIVFMLTLRPRALFRVVRCTFLVRKGIQYLMRIGRIAEGYSLAFSLSLWTMPERVMGEYLSAVYVKLMTNSGYCSATRRWWLANWTLHAVQVSSASESKNFVWRSWPIGKEMWDKLLSTRHNRDGDSRHFLSTVSLKNQDEGMDINMSFLGWTFVHAWHKQSELISW